METNHTFIGNGLENPSGQIINIGIMVDKIPKEMLLDHISRKGNKHKMLYITVKRKTDKEGNHILDQYGNSHFVFMDDKKIEWERNKLNKGTENENERRDRN